jgi:hypothetical protein
MKFFEKMSSALFKETRVMETPIFKEGINYKEIKSKGFNGHFSAKDFVDKPRLKEFTPTTVIVREGYAEWDLEIPRDILKNLIDTTLKIETIRTHGMLHASTKGRKASIYVNDNLVDEISLDRRHPHGKDYGVDSRRPIPILSFIDKNIERQIIKVQTDKDTSWDIDRITIEPITKVRELKPFIFMIIGAIVSGIIGVIISIIVSYF